MVVCIVGACVLLIYSQLYYIQNQFASHTEQKQIWMGKFHDIKQKCL